MPTQFSPYVVVDSPSRKPALHGLTETAQVVVENGERWLGGFSWMPQNLVELTVQDPENLVATNDPLSNPLPNPQSFVVAYPWMMEVASGRITWGFEANDYPARVREWIEWNTTLALEKEFWTGSLGMGNQDLVSTMSYSATPLKPIRTLGVLEKEIADSGFGLGMIHATPELVTHWTAWGAVEEVNGKLISKATGALVVPGQGYTGAGPTDSADAAPTAQYVWAYATALCQVRLSPVTVVPDDVGQALNRRNNELQYRAWRYGSVNYDPQFQPFSQRVDLDTGF